MADPLDLGHLGSHTWRRMAAVVAMLAGAISGAFLVLDISTGAALGAAAAILAGVAVTARRQGTSTELPSDEI